MVVALTACTGAQDAERADAVRKMQARLDEITSTAASLMRESSPSDVASELAYLYGDEVYTWSANSGEPQWYLVFSTDASYTEFVANHQVVLGGCIKMNATKNPVSVETESIDCTKRALYKAYPEIDEQVDILSDGS